MSELGYVYALINASMPGLVKIGRTTRDPYQRASELSSTTGVPTPFVHAYSIYVADQEEAEAKIHTILDGRGFRTNGQREFFRVELSIVIDLFIQIQSQFVVIDMKELSLTLLSVEKEIERLLKLGENCQYGENGAIPDKEDAIKWYQKALKIGSDEAAYRIAQVYHDENNFKSSLKYAKEGFSKGSEKCLLLMAVSYSMLEEPESSLAAFKRYFSTNHFATDRYARLEAGREYLLSAKKYSFDIKLLQASFLPFKNEVINDSLSLENQISSVADVNSFKFMKRLHLELLAKCFPEMRQDCFGFIGMEVTQKSDFNSYIIHEQDGKNYRFDFYKDDTVDPNLPHLFIHGAIFIAGDTELDFGHAYLVELVKYPNNDPILFLENLANVLETP